MIDIPSRHFSERKCYKESLFSFNSVLRFKQGIHFILSWDKNRNYNWLVLEVSLSWTLNTRQINDLTQVNNNEYDMCYKIYATTALPLVTRSVDPLPAFTFALLIYHLEFAVARELFFVFSFTAVKGIVWNKILLIEVG